MNATIDLRGSGQRQLGPDHPHHAWQPLHARAPHRWPNGARVAVCAMLALDAHEDEVPAGWPQVQWAQGGVGLRPDPNIARIGARDYGLRRGFYRLAGGLKSLQLPYALAIDVLSAENHPALVDAVNQGEWGRVDWVAHGLSWNRPLHAGLDEASERAYIDETRARLSACGIHTPHWFGIEYGQSPRTPELLPQAGYTTCLDWCNDEQPYRFASGLWSLPQMADLDDGFSLCAPRGISPQAYARRLVDAARALAAEGEHQGRLMVFTLRPFLSGQPFRVDPILNAFAQMQGTPGVWFATPTDILHAWTA